MWSQQNHIINKGDVTHFTYFSMISFSIQQNNTIKSSTAKCTKTVLTLNSLLEYSSTQEVLHKK